MADATEALGGLELLRRLGRLARARRARGDHRLALSPVPQLQEYFELDPATAGPNGYVLEPDGAPFRVQKLRPRRGKAGIGAFCDGTRATYLLGFDDVFPLLYTENLAAARARDPERGYHQSFAKVQRGHCTLLLPLALLEPQHRLAYTRLGLCPTSHADLCWFGDNAEAASPLAEMREWGNLAWQASGQRRARRLMEISEQVTALAAAETLRRWTPDGTRWLLCDGPLFIFDRQYLRPAYRHQLRQVVGSVKTHPVPFFGVDGERSLAAMRVGERSAAFLPRSPDDAKRGVTLVTSPRPIVSWYLRVKPPAPHGPEHLSGVVRLDTAAHDDWHDWVDEVSWAVLDEFYGLSALPDARYDVMPYGIAECERFLHSQRLPADLLLAGLAT